MSIRHPTPNLDNTSALQIVGDRFDLVSPAVAGQLPSERDQNFLISASQGQFVFKVSNRNEDRAVLEAQHQMLQHLAERGIEFVPQIICSRDQQSQIEFDFAGDNYAARLVSYIPGQPLARRRYRNHKLLRNLGKALGRLDNALLDFDHPALHREFHWDLAGGLDWVASNRAGIDDQQLRQQCDTLLARIRRHSQTHFEELPKSAIHNDANDANLIVPPTNSSDADQIRGLIDFGDAVYSWTVNDLAIAIAYAILDQDNPLASAASVAAGYDSVRRLSHAELAALFGLVGLRLCTSVVNAGLQVARNPDNEYLTVSQRPISRTLPDLVAIDFQYAHAVLRQACGRPPVPRVTRLEHDLTAERNNVQFPLPRNERTRFCLLDLSVGSELLSRLPQPPSHLALGRRLQRVMQQQQADIGIGRYLEPRILYQSDQFAGDSRERRTIHLGIDLFAAAGTEVLAALDGTVHRVATIDRPLDYGTLVILKHTAAEGDEFFTLYGHLAQRTKSQVEPGQAVRAGQRIGFLGDPYENGGWTPHLHFQLIADLWDYDIQFPGVGFASTQAVWNAISPDPNLILNLPQETTFQQIPPEQLLKQRRQVTGGNLSLSYADPVAVVRGYRQYLFDQVGHRYLDAYNNVPHVGHSHPAVLAALERQARLLNTNTRYLDPGFVEYAQRLAATLPDGLEVCFLVNSASEANELALRLARAATGARDLIVLERAYHGHTTSLIDISPYKNQGPGGAGTPDWVHVAPIPDLYRGEFQDPETAGPLYASRLDQIINRSGERGAKLCGFIAESCPSVGGQIIFPPGYLQDVYRFVRNAGGVCIADEVQTGLGRLGTVFYGFELQQVTPDIVVLGKPIGNGHPLAAVVTTREIADRFDNGMEFFSTFGGNTVACRVGWQVLEVLQHEQLQENARQVGNYLLNRLRNLQKSHPLLGDVRGSGLFLGVELVRNPVTLEPADLEASWIVNRMRQRGILVGTDGHLHNVIKIRPPLCFDRGNADELLSTLEQTLDELT